MVLNTWLGTARLVVCVGAGGVGKTTTSAAIALQGAKLGRRTLVLTIDPARRLVDSLGLEELGNEPVRVDLASIGGASGELWAMMLDSKGTFEELIRRLSPDEGVRDRILGSKVFRYMAGTLAGSQDYMAAERLYDLHHSGQYDLIVLDTPPVKNALDFLEAPARVVHFLDERILSWFLTQSERMRSSGSLLHGPSALVWHLLGQVFGLPFLEDLADFFREFRTMHEGLEHRHSAVASLLAGEATSFAIVAAPSASSIDVAAYFREELAERGLRLGGVIVNQVHRCEGLQHDAEAALGDAFRQVDPDCPPALSASVLARLGMAHRRLRAIAVADQAVLARLRPQVIAPAFWTEVPRLDEEVHDVSGLAEIARHLFAEDQRGATVPS